MTMETAQIIARFGEARSMPMDAIAAARADRAAAVPAFIQAIEEYAPGLDESAPNPLFWIFHLLGEWHEKSAYRPLARMLRRSPDQLDWILGDASTETSHRVMAAVFDGDPTPLYEVILDPEADEFIRSRMCETIAMLTRDGEMPRAEAERFLRACCNDIVPQGENVVWLGWQSAIALLGFVELTPLVARAFAAEFISPSVMSFEHFEADLKQAVDDPIAFHDSPDNYTLFGDTIEELSKWADYKNEPQWQQVKEPKSTIPYWREHFDGPAVNPYRDVGRNDPCPCGSGRKFKKCCLNDSLDRSLSAA
jgi:uncharacterized protein